MRVKAGCRLLLVFKNVLFYLLEILEKEIRRRKCRMYCFLEFRGLIIKCAVFEVDYEGLV